VTELQCLPVWTEDDRLFLGVHSYRAAPEHTSEALPFELSRCMTVIFVVCCYGESPQPRLLMVAVCLTSEMTVVSWHAHTLLTHSQV